MSCRTFRYGKVKESYGVITWLDEHGPRAMTQVIPDGDIASSGLQFGTIGFPYPGMTWKIEAPENLVFIMCILKTKVASFSQCHG